MQKTAKVLFKLIKQMCNNMFIMYASCLTVLSNINNGMFTQIF